MTTLPGRISRLALVTALAMAGPVAVSSGPAQAGPIVCDPNSTWYTTAGSSTYEVTHVSGYHVPPGGQTTITKTASWSKTLTAGINVSTGGSASASSVIAKAEATFSVSLNASGSATSTSSQSVATTLGGSSSDRYYGVYQGRRNWSGTWTKKACSGNGQTSSTIGTGTWRSFQTKLEGAALCPSSNYSSGTLAYKACKATWG